MEAWKYEHIESSHDIAGVMADDKVLVSLQSLVLRFHLTTRVVFVTFELLVHCMQKMLHKEMQYKNNVHV